MTVITLRGATAADADDIAALFATSRRLLTFLPDLHSIEEDRVYMRDKVMVDCRVTAAERAGRIVGFMAELDGWIEHLYIDAARLGTGIGSALIADAKSRNQNLALWCFAENLRGRAFYEKHGFVAVEFTDGAGNEARAPDILYRWQP
ncbi:MAG TPA: GNAT family N-acetyltransferase [Devosiaceae bacterium]|nr:GNAT family N-acetyltransferase [Devosiaceae bacterium]